MITAPRRHKHLSSGANRPSDVGVTVNINAEFNLMALNPIMECFSRDLVTEYCHGLETSTVHTAPPVFVETHPGRSNRSLPCLPLHLDAQANIPQFVTSNSYIGLWLPKCLTLTRLWSYVIFDVLLLVRNIKIVGLGGILNYMCWEMHFRTGRQEGFLSRREFHSLYTPKSELHHQIFAEQLSRCRYPSMLDLHPVHYTPTVNRYSNPPARSKQS